MNDNNQNNQNNQNNPSKSFESFFPEESNEPLSIDVPAEPPLTVDRVPSGYEPMGEIELRGRTYRGLASGQVPWWVLITGWVIFGGIAAVLLHVAIASSSFTAWILVAIAVLLLFVMARGTVAKFSSQQGRR